MEPAPRQQFQPAGAGALLLAATVVCILIGALVGAAFGAWPYGALGGAVVGIPFGVFVVYRRYRGAFS
jgi:F0F1-type ATP synthase assembly protein I